MVIPPCATARSLPDLHVSLHIGFDVLRVYLAIDELKTVIQDAPYLKVIAEHIEITALSRLELHVCVPAAVVDLAKEGPSVVLG